MLARWALVVGLAVASFAVSGCMQVDAVSCNGRVCPVGSTCDLATGRCIPPGCGDGEVRGDEQCDGVIPPGVDCTAPELGSHYLPSGLSCNAVCELDATTCEGGRCGDHAINGPEICDGIPPAGQTCIDYGFGSGRLECSGCIPEFDACGAIGWREMAGGATATLRAIWGSSQHDLFAVGFAGSILHSKGGAWAEMSSGTTADLYGVWGSGPNDVYAVGDGTILHFDGTEWTALAVPEQLRGIWGSASNDVIAVGTGGTILRFDGTTWTKTTPTAQTLNAVWGRSANEAYAVGDVGTILRWNGTSWAAMAAPALVVGSSGRELRAIWGTADRVFAVGGSRYGGLSDGVILELAGSGSWTVFRTFPLGLYSVWAASSTDVFFGGYVGALYHLDGTAVLSQESGSLRTLFAIWGTGPASAFAVTNGGSIQEYRGVGLGVEQLTAASLGAVRELDDGTVVAVGNGSTGSGRIHRYVAGSWDGGAATNVDGQMLGVWGLTSNELFAVSENGTASGLSRIAAFAPATVLYGSFHAVWATARTDVWCAGHNGTIGRYNGVTATAAPPTDACPGPTCAHLRGIWGSGPGDIFAVGENKNTGASEIRHYDGTSWSAMPAPTTARLNAVWGTGPANVFAVGNSGAMLRYDGTSWRTMTSGTGENLLNVHGTGPADVFVSGTNGTLLHYDGVAWTPLRLPTIDVLWGLWAGRSRTWVASDTGKILRIDRARVSVEARCADGWDDDHDGPFDCADPDCASDPACTSGGTCARIAIVGCDQVLEGSTYTGIARIDDLACLADAHPGPEASYRFDAQGTGQVTVSLLQPSIDLAVAVVGTHGEACDPTSCVGETTGTTATFTATAGQSYYVVVDGPRDLAGTFTLAIDCRSL